MSRTDTASRVIHASAQTLYEAHLAPEAVAQWRPPDGMRAEIYRFDARVGGGYRMALVYADSAGTRHGKTTDNSDVISGEFLDLVPGARIVERVQFESDSARFHGAMTLTTTFSETAQGTEVHIVCENVPAGISADDHAVGMASTLANLAAYVE